MNELRSTMNVKEFFDRFGVDTTSNFQLIHWAKELGFKLHYAMRDEIKQLKFKNKPMFIVANYHESNQSGIHHVGIYKNKNISYFIDPYGIQPFKEAVDFMEEGVYSSFRIQPDGSKMCGQLALYFLYSLSQDRNFYDIILEMNDYFIN